MLYYQELSITRYQVSVYAKTNMSKDQKFSVPLTESITLRQALHMTVSYILVESVLQQTVKCHWFIKPFTG